MNKKVNKFKNYDAVMEYAQNIVEGKTVANKYRVKGCERFFADLNNLNYCFDPKNAELVINIIEETFCHQQGEMLDGNSLRGTPFLLTIFHKFIIYNLLGFYLKDTQIRRFKEAYLGMLKNTIIWDKKQNSLLQISKDYLCA